MKYKILVAEDDLIERMVLCKTLRKHLDPIRAEHAERAKEAATRKAYKQKYRKNDPMNVFRKEWNNTLGTVQR